MELRFDISNSSILSEEQKQILLEKLANKITSDGILQVVSQKERSQILNKELCIHKFYKLIEKALTPAKKRKATRPTKASKEKRLANKKILSEKKSRRRKDEL